MSSPDLPESAAETSASLQRRASGHALGAHAARDPDAWIAEDTVHARAWRHRLHRPVQAKAHGRWLLRLMLAFWAGAILWAALAQVDEVVVGEGRVIPSGQVRQVQNLEGGIVAEILVAEGDAVERDQPLLRLDPVRFASSLGENEAKLRALSARIARLEAEAGDAPFAAMHGGPEEARLAQQERALYVARRQALRASIAVLRQEAAQREQELAEKRSRARQLQGSRTLLARELTMIRPLVAQGYVAELQQLRLTRQLNDLDGELDAARLALPRLESAWTGARERARELEARFRADAGRELSEARAERNALAAAGAELRDRLRRTEVRSPVAGIVKQLKVHTVGGVIQPGMEMLEIVPRDESLLIEARVKPADIAFLRAGQPAIVRLSAYDFSIYGGLHATLEHVSADSLLPERPGETPGPYYLVRVRTRGTTPTGGGKPLTILPGMVATVDIVTGRKTVLHYLLKPLIKVKETMLRER
ncbi:HlyD family type I secretion periplasmic adaptor subunit [Noviherbaspirillum pedocola]|uniref:Membrane fusion protein (MFP) family protein n=1 Tax=Noviherbaspirillum pedocola TaxID=2801341 RepID=A0A934SZC8_9BURK|nr:HlyD family type I secretion periplasmic adaptor subunit [Noviherbaspirillum pedocola]MBK4738454.1 HlyD family type I secretion periplasmic adaptor subunit [Noviherbaspirillum pedocola]